MAVQESFKRLLGPAMETEIRLELKRRADEESIRVFADNLRELLLASPLGQKTVLAIDPGFRTGCKVVLLDAQGKLLHNDVVYPEQGARSAAEAAERVLAFIKHFKVEAVAIGNGTAGRETEAFLRKLNLPPSMPILMVNESGASIYSASDVAREEFPDHDLTVRGAVSIGRRLMDPLAELVKLDPKSIGVGQYQHDVDQGALKKSLDDVVISCVNRVGVELNTASKQLLAYVSGIGPSVAEAIVAFRNENGPFKSRQELTTVPRLGATRRAIPSSMRWRAISAVRCATWSKASCCARRSACRNTCPKRWGCQPSTTFLASWPSRDAIRARNSRCFHSPRGWTKSRI